MKLIRRLLCVLLVSGGAVPAHAGIPVIDALSFQQAVLEVLNSVQQISNQVTQITNQITAINNQIKQIQQLRDQFEALTGSRNLGEILNNPLLHNYVPPDLVENYNDLQK